LLAKETSFIALTNLKKNRLLLVDSRSSADGLIGTDDNGFFAEFVDQIEDEILIEHHLRRVFDVSHLIGM
jgi:hypothetical protein